MACFSSTTRARPIRLRRHHGLGRSFVTLWLLVALLAASSVVSADALLHWRAIVWSATVSSGEPDRIVWPSTAAGEEQPPHPAAVPAVSVDPSDKATLPTGETGGILRSEDYFESWRQAGSGPEQTGERLRSHQVNVGPKGRLIGELTSLDAATGALHPLPRTRIWLSRGGSIRVTARTDESGLFEVSGLTTGTYALFVANDDALVTFALHVRQVALMDDAPSPEAGIRPPQLPLQIAAVTGADAAAVLRRIAATPQGSDPPVREIEPEVARIPEPVRPLRQSGVPGTTLVTHRVRLKPGGWLVGRVRRLHPESGRHLLPPTTTVALMQKEEVVATGATDSRGCFRIANVRAGIYAVVATTNEQRTPPAMKAGQQAVGLFEERPQPPSLATFAIEVVAAGTGDPDRFSFPPRPRAAADDEPLELDFALIDTQDLLAMTRERSSGLERASKLGRSGNAQLASRSTGLPAAASSSAPQPPVRGAVGGSGAIPLTFFPPTVASNGVISPAVP